MKGLRTSKNGQQKYNRKGKLPKHDPGPGSDTVDFHKELNLGSLLAQTDAFHPKFKEGVWRAYNK